MTSLESGPPEPSAAAARAAAMDGARAAQREQTRGLLFFAGAVVIYGLTFAAAKYASAELGAVQLVWARFAFHFLLALLLVGPAAWGRLALSGRLPLQLMASVALMASTGFYYAALSFLPLADATALYFVAPLILTLFAALILREPVGARRWAAVAIGFGGALVIMRPGSDVFQWAALLCIGSAVCFSLYQILTRIISRHVSPREGLVFAALGATLATSAVVPFFWTGPSPLGWALMVFVGVGGYAATYCMYRALERVSASTIAPYSYSDLVWSMVLGLIVFGDFPDRFTLLGAAIIVVSGLYVFYRERRKGVPSQPVVPR